MNLLLTKNTTIGYNTIVDDAADKYAVEDHHVAEDTMTIRKQNRRKMFLAIGGSVSACVVGVLLFCATQASSSLPSSMSSLRTAALLEDSRENKAADGWFQCYPNGHGCYSWLAFTNGGCCDTATCVSKGAGTAGDACDGFFDSCVCKDDPTTAPSLPPTKSPTNRPTNQPTPKACVHSKCGVDDTCCGQRFCSGGNCIYLN